MTMFAEVVNTMSSAPQKPGHDIKSSIMIPKTYIIDLQPEAYVQTTFLVTAKAIKQTRHGDDFLAVTLCDKTGAIEARAWEQVEMLANRFEAGQYVAISGVVTPFQNEQQIRLLDLEVVLTQHIEPSDYLPSSTWPPQNLFNQLVDVLETELRVEPMRRFVQTLFAQQWLIDPLKLSPAATNNHHQYLSGLIEHILSMVRIAVGLANHYALYYPGLLDKDLLLVGCLMHDLGKCQELSFEHRIAYTTSGRLMGHITQGVAIIDAVAAQMHPAPPEDMILELKHLVLSHHGKLDYGSPVRPQSPEAVILHQIDMIDSRANMCWQAITKTQHQTPQEQWTPYQRPLEGRMYLGDRLTHQWRSKPALTQKQCQGPGLLSPETQTLDAPQPPLAAAAKRPEQPRTMNLFGDD